MSSSQHHHVVYAETLRRCSSIVERSWRGEEVVCLLPLGGLGRGSARGGEVLDAKYYE
jgi:hypothetical protein